MADDLRQFLELLEGFGPPLQAVPAIDDIDVARTWFEVLPAQVIEGIVAQRASSPYRPGRASWRKIRHSETVDAGVVGYTGSPARPKQLAVRLPDGRTVLTQTLTAVLAAQITPCLAAAGPSRRARTTAGESYAVLARDMVVEVAAGTTWHAVVTLMRVRSASGAVRAGGRPYRATRTDL
ncbi:hypothetical protein [Streptomyces sp. NPDC050264]|uniref:hypothetical protein n=1 Tax=Streptomyces sp. NPDC050264 TaxID=3155038 RepID=UPI00341BFFDD